MAMMLIFENLNLLKPGPFRLIERPKCHDAHTVVDRVPSGRTTGQEVQLIVHEILSVLFLS